MSSEVQAEKKRTRAPRGTLDRQKILDSALELLDQHGPEKVTMRAIANLCNVQAMALYRHFHTKDELMTAVIDHVVSQLPGVPPGLSPVESVDFLARSYYMLLCAHPGLLRVDTGNGTDGDGARHFSEAVYSVLLAAGMDPKSAISLGASVNRFILGSALLHPLRKEQDSNYWDEVRGSLLTLSVRQFPTLHALGETLPNLTQQDIFEYGLIGLLSPLQSLE